MGKPFGVLWRAISLGAVGGGKHFDDKADTRISRNGFQS
jgi:hypothetical protein